MKIYPRLVRFFILSVLGLVLGAGIAALSILMEKTPSTESVSIPMVAPSIGGDFELINQDGKTVSNKDFLGKYMLIYFGFTYCPAICPTELQKITEAYKDLPKAWQDRIQPIFISVDPERDTPDVLKGYVGLFMPELLGLTGTPAQIDAVKKAYKVYASKVPEGDGKEDGYTMDHSSFIYYMGPDGAPLAMYKMTDTAEAVSKSIVSLDGLD